ncbi:MAG: hypothetical protein KGZ72_12185 [Roseovarius sp.]|nr:hypothetical protein [Roseovarius sp.]
MGRQLLAANVTPRPTSKNLQETGPSLQKIKQAVDSSKADIEVVVSRHGFET